MRKRSLWPKSPNMVIWIKISEKINFRTSLREDKFSPIAFPIALNHNHMIMFLKDIAKVPKIGFLGPMTLLAIK